MKSLFTALMMFTGLAISCAVYADSKVTAEIVFPVRVVQNTGNGQVHVMIDADLSVADDYRDAVRIYVLLPGDDQWLLLGKFDSVLAALVPTSTAVDPALRESVRTIAIDDFTFTSPILTLLSKKASRKDAVENQVTYNDLVTLLQKNFPDLTFKHREMLGTANGMMNPSLLTKLERQTQKKLNTVPFPLFAEPRVEVPPTTSSDFRRKSNAGRPEPIFAGAIVFDEENPSTRNIEVFKLGVDQKANLILQRVSDGKWVIIKVGATTIPKLGEIKIDSGILSSSEFRREVDLWNFDADVKVKGDTLPLRSVSSDKPSLNDPNDVVPPLPTRIDRAYVDLVKEARKRIDLRASHPFQSAQLVSETQTKLVQYLRVGKSSALLDEEGGDSLGEVELLIEQIARGLIPELPRTLEIRMVTSATFGAGTSYRGQVEDKIEELDAYGGAFGNFWVMSDLHVFAGDRRGGDGSTQKMKDGLRNGNLRVIGTSSKNAFGLAFDRDPAFKTLVPSILVQELKGERLLARLRYRLREKEIEIPSDQILEQGLALSSKFAMVGVQPALALELFVNAALIRDKKGGGLMEVSDLNEGITQIHSLDPNLFTRAAMRVKLDGLIAYLDSKITGATELKKAIYIVFKNKIAGVGDPNVINAILADGESGTGKTSTFTLAARYLGFGFVRIDMSSFASSFDVEAAKAELYAKTSNCPMCIVLLDEFDKAHAKVQEAMLLPLQNGHYTIDQDPTAGRHSFTNVRAENLIFALGSNATANYMKTLVHGSDASASVGFTASQLRDNSNQRSTDLATPATNERPIDDRQFREKIVKGGIIRAIVSRIAFAIPMFLPTRDQFKAAMIEKMRETLQQESLKPRWENGTIVQFSLTNSEIFIDAMVDKYYVPGVDYRQVGFTISKNLLILISEALMDAKIDTHNQVAITWSQDAVEAATTGKTCRDYLSFSKILPVKPKKKKLTAI